MNPVQLYAALQIYDALKFLSKLNKIKGGSIIVRQHLLSLCLIYFITKSTQMLHNF